MVAHTLDPGGSGKWMHLSEASLVYIARLRAYWEPFHEERKEIKKREKRCPQVVIGFQ